MTDLLKSNRRRAILQDEKSFLRSNWELLRSVEAAYQHVDSETVSVALDYAEEEESVDAFHLFLEGVSSSYLGPSDPSIPATHWTPKSSIISNLELPPHVYGENILTDRYHYPKAMPAIYSHDYIPLFELVYVDERSTPIEASNFRELRRMDSPFLLFEYNSALLQRSVMRYGRVFLRLDLGLTTPEEIPLDMSTAIDSLDAEYTKNQLTEAAWLEWMHHEYVVALNTEHPRWQGYIDTRYHDLRAIYERVAARENIDISEFSGLYPRDFVDDIAAATTLDDLGTKKQQRDYRAMDNEY